jgi:hypothetical protein
MRWISSDLPHSEPFPGCAGQRNDFQVATLAAYWHQDTNRFDEVRVQIMDSGQNAFRLDPNGNLGVQMMGGGITAYNFNEPGVGRTDREKIWAVVEGTDASSGELVRFRTMVVVGTGLNGNAVNAADYGRLWNSVGDLGLLDGKILAAGHTHPSTGNRDVSPTDSITAARRVFPSYMLFPNFNTGLYELNLVVPDPNLEDPEKPGLFWSGKNHTSLVGVTPISR